MEINVWHEQARVPVAVLRVKGNLYSNEELEAKARELHAAGIRNILLDLTDVPYMASAGLRALHQIYTLLRSDTPEESDEAVRRGIAAGTWTSPHLKLLKPNRNVLEVLKMAGYDMFLEIHKDFNKAVASF
jgi:2-iminoacetate synthase ThiH